MAFPQSLRSTPVLAVAVALAYYALSRVGLDLVDPDTGVAALWPASGFAAAVFVLAGPRRWALLVGVVFVANLLAQAHLHGLTLLSAGLAAANALEPLVAAFVMRTVLRRGRRRMGEISEAAGLLAGAACASAVGATIGATALHLAFDVSWAGAVRPWFLADALGIIVITPLILEARGSHQRRSSGAETIVALLVVAVLAIAIFAFDSAGADTVLRWPFLMLPALLWVAIRTSRREIVLAMAFTGITAAVGTAHGAGPFVQPQLAESQSFLLLQVYLAVVLACTLLVAAVTLRGQSAESRLAAERERFASVLRAATEYSVVATDLDGVITVFNDGAERMLGYAATEVIGIASPERFHVESEVVARAAELGVEPGFDVFVATARQGASEARRWTYRHRDGHDIPVSLTVTAITGPGGAPTGFIGIAHDVSEQERAQAKLRLSEAHHRQVVTSLPDTMVSLYDRDLRCELAEGALLGKLGYSPEHFVGRQLEDTVPAEQAAAIGPAIRAALDGEHVALDAFTTSNGTVLAVELVPMRSDEGTVTHAMLVSRDITSRSLAEAERVAAEMRFRGAFEYAPVGMAVLELDGRLAKVNEALRVLAGRDTEAFTASSILELTHLEDVDDVREGWQWLLNGSLETWSGEQRIVQPGGREIQCAVHTTLLRDASGAPQHFLTHLVDVTERRRFEQRLRYMAEHDALTGLVNRRRFESDLSRHLRAVGGSGVAAGALILIDIDHFKRVNDTLGHAAGDDLLIAVSGALRARLRGSDVVARLGGDEFAVLLPGVTRGQAEQVAADLAAAVRDDGEEASVLRQRMITLSVGVAMCKGHTSMESAMREADLAMYEAKRAGRDGYAIAP